AGLVSGLLAGAAAAALALLQIPFVENVELASFDARSAAAAPRQPASSNVVIVAIDEETRLLNQGVYPISRGALAAIVDGVRAAGAKAIAIDLLLTNPLEATFADENAALE